MAISDLATLCAADYPLAMNQQTNHPFNPVFADRPVTIFAVMSALANKYGAVNLGQGFPDEQGPDEIIRLAADGLITGNNQYTPVTGIPRLKEAVARANKRFYDLDIDPVDGVLVTSGASEALAASFLAFLKPGDEAILFAPFYDSYAPMIEAAGAVPVIIDLAPPDWRINATALEAAISQRTKLIAINSPHNPLGKVMSRDELLMIAKAAQRHDLLVICDEVYEHLVFDGHQHVPLMTLEGMKDRCVRIGSAGKTFSLTGWRIGYLSGPPKLVSVVTKARQFLGYTTAAHLQSAVAHGLDFPDTYYTSFTRAMQDKRDFLMDGLRRIGFDVLACDGTYFITVDISTLTDRQDREFCETLTIEAGVTAVPLSAFYHHALSMPPTHYIRFCFCKKQSVLTEALARLSAYFTNPKRG